MQFNYESPIVPPVTLYKFTKTMKVGDENEEVKELQKFLQKLGMFPANATPTGYFGGVTKKGVIAFQLSRSLVGDGVVGLKTLAELNK